MKLFAALAAPRAQRLSSPVWLWPALSGAVALAATLLLLRVNLSVVWSSFLWPGDVSAAAAAAQTVAGAVVTVTAMTFSLTVVALQLASQQFSPRLLHEFAQDPVTKAVLSVLVAAFVMALTTLRALRQEEPVPALASLAVLCMGLAALAAVLAFISHLVRVLRVDTMMLAVHGETRDAIATFYPAYDDERPREAEPELVGQGDPHVVPVAQSGFVRLVEVKGLVAGARDLDLFVRLLCRPGDHVVSGTPLAQAWKRSDGAPADVDAVNRLLHRTIDIGHERSLAQDAAYGFRQLEDIAVKALSPGINDPVTAAHAIGHMGDLLAQLTSRRQGPTVHEDDNGVGRATIPDRDFGYYLDLACGQARRYARQEPTVLIALLRMLRDVGVVARDDHQRTELAQAASLVVDAADSGLLPSELESVQTMAARVSTALYGDPVDAYSDRAGETRSI